MTSHYILDRMDQVSYEEEVGYWKLEVERKTVAVTGENGLKSPDDMNISFQPDMMRLMLLKHWNLYDSMFHSSYVATRLGIWKEKGRQRLTNLLVKLG
jgi:cell division control protein 45